MTNKNLRYGLDEALSNMFSNPNYASTYLFYAHMIGMCSVKIDTDLPAAAGVSFQHDHYNLYINPTQFDKYSLEERLAILKHEMLHILGNHLGSRLGDKNVTGWNYATDCAINQMIEQSHLPKVSQKELDEAVAAGQKLRPGVKAGDIASVIPSNYPAKKGINIKFKESAEYYYEILDKPDDNKCPNCGGDTCDNSKGKGQNDSDSDSEGNDSDQNDGNGNGESQKGKCSCSGGNGNPSKTGDHGIWKESEGDKELQKDITKTMVEKAVNQTQKSRGDLPSNISEILELLSRKNEVDWKKVLRSIVGNKRTSSRRTIMRSDRRFPSREDLRGKTKDRMFNLLLVSDVSGSVSDKALLDLWGEVRHICKTTNSDVDLIQVDAQAYKPEKLTAHTKILTRKAAGGTVLNPALDKADEHRINYNAIVVTTDGYLSESDVQRFHDTGKKVIWLIEKDGAIMDSMKTGRSMAFKLKE